MGCLFVLFSSSISGAEDIHSSRATIDSETSSAGIVSSQTNGESTSPKGNELDVDEGDEEPRLNQFKKNFIIKVKEANQPTDSTLTAKQTEVLYRYTIQYPAINLKEVLALLTDG